MSQSQSKNDNISCLSRNIAKLINKLMLLNSQDMTHQRRADIPKISVAYEGVHDLFVHQIKIHLGKSKKLIFNQPLLYFKAIDDGCVVADNSFESDLRYIFLSLTNINGKANNSQIKNGYILTFDKGGNVHYSYNNFINLFFFNKDAQIVPSIELESKNDLVQEDQNEVKQIFKKILESYSDSYNILKNVPQDYQEIICHTLLDISHADYYVELITCLEIFEFIDYQ